MSNLEDRLATLEKQTHEIIECLEQIAKDADLMGVNVMRTLKGMQGLGSNPAQQEPGLWTWNPTQIKWQQETGLKGPYEKSDDVNSLDFKAMLKDLGEHAGKLNREGRFYWIFQNGSTVGRTMPK